MSISLSSIALSILKCQYYYISVDVESFNGKKETHTQTENSKKRYCGYIKSKKNLTIHLKQVTIYIYMFLFQIFF